MKATLWVALQKLNGYKRPFLHNPSVSYADTSPYTGEA